MRRLGQKHHLELDEHAQIAAPACDQIPLTWNVHHGLHRIDTINPPIETFDDVKPLKRYRTLLVAMSISAVVVLFAIWRALS